MNTKGHPIASFQPSSLDLCYKFLDAETNMDVEWFDASSKEVNKLALIKSWSIDCKRMREYSNGLYNTKRLQKLFQIIMSLLCRLNRMRDAIVYRKECVPLASENYFNKIIFNWGEILSSNMKLVVEETKHNDIKLKSHFFM